MLSKRNKKCGNLLKPFGQHMNLQDCLHYLGWVCLIFYHINTKKIIIDYQKRLDNRLTDYEKKLHDMTDKYEHALTESTKREEIQQMVINETIKSMATLVEKIRGLEQIILMFRKKDQTLMNGSTEIAIRQFIEAKEELEQTTKKLESVLKNCYADQQKHLNGKVLKLPFDKKE